MRDGLHTACCAYARVNAVPRRASASMLGVLTGEGPNVPPSGRRSSTDMKSTFGLTRWAAAASRRTLLAGPADTHASTRIPASAAMPFLITITAAG